MTHNKNKHIGSSFESFLKTEKLLEDVTRSAIKAIEKRKQTNTQKKNN